MTREEPGEPDVRLELNTARSLLNQAISPFVNYISAGLMTEKDRYLYEKRSLSIYLTDSLLKASCANSFFKPIQVSDRPAGPSGWA